MKPEVWLLLISLPLEGVIVWRTLVMCLSVYESRKLGSRIGGRLIARMVVWTLLCPLLAIIGLILAFSRGPEMQAGDSTGERSSANSESLQNGGRLL